MLEEPAPGQDGTRWGWSWLAPPPATCREGGPALLGRARCQAAGENSTIANVFLLSGDRTRCLWTRLDAWSSSLV